jgi:hypothetical protein
VSIIAVPTTGPEGQAGTAPKIDSVQSSRTRSPFLYDDFRVSSALSPRRNAFEEREFFALFMKRKEKKRKTPREKTAFEGVGHVGALAGTVTWYHVC